jgi:hypothetical protein
MRVGNFSVLVYPGVERDSGYVQLAHGTQYRVKMINHYANRQVDAEVAVDGKPVGTFRLWGGADMTLDGPPDKSGLFTFYARDTEEFAAAAGAGAGGSSSTRSTWKSASQALPAREAARKTRSWALSASWLLDRLAALAMASETHRRLSAASRARCTCTASFSPTASISGCSGSQ